MASGSSKVNLLFILLAVYVILQFLWWAYLLLNLNTDYYHLKQELYLAWGVGDDSNLMEELANRKRMVLGEGMIFLLLLIVGIVFTARYMRRDIQVAKLQRNFLLSVSHELKTPLAATKLYLQTLQKRQLDSQKQAELVERALSGNHRLEKLVEKIILATQLESSRFELSHQTFLLKPIVAETVDVIRSIDTAFHQFEWDCPEDIKLCMDQLAMETMLLNLLENAVKYSPNDTLIELKVVRLNAEVSIEVKNEGRIPTNERKLVFHKFFRGGNEETRTAKGTGVGLYLVSKLAQLHGGSVSLNAEDSQVVFKLKLPIR